MLHAEASRAVLQQPVPQAGAWSACRVAARGWPTQRCACAQCLGSEALPKRASMRRLWAAGRSAPRPRPGRAGARAGRPRAPSVARPRASRHPCTPAPAQSARGPPRRRSAAADRAGSRAGAAAAAATTHTATRRSAAGRRSSPARRPTHKARRQRVSRRGRAWPLSGAWYAPTKRTRPGSSTSHSAFTSFIIWWRLSCGACAAGPALSPSSAPMPARAAPQAAQPQPWPQGAEQQPKSGAAAPSRSS